MPAAGFRTQLLHLIFTEPGNRTLAHPCRHLPMIWVVNVLSKVVLSIDSLIWNSFEGKFRLAAILLFEDVVWEFESVHRSRDYATSMEVTLVKKGPG